MENYTTYDKRQESVSKPIFDTIIHSLSTQGLLGTKKRIRVIKAVCEFSHITDAEELWITLHRQEKISRASVYKTLYVLREMGFLARFERGHHLPSSYTLIDNQV